MEKNKPKAFKGEVVVDRFTKTVTASGNAGHIPVLKQYVGDKAEIKIYKKWMMCQRCNEMYSDEEDFSEDDRYCKRCFNAIKFWKSLKPENKKCRVCSKKIDEGTYKALWDDMICENCWEKEQEELNKKLNKGGDKRRFKIE